MNAKVILVILVVVLAVIVIAFHSLTVLSTVLLIGAGAFAFLHQDAVAEGRRLPWQTWFLTGLSVAIYLVDWLVLGH